MINTSIIPGNLDKVSGGHENLFSKEIFNHGGVSIATQGTFPHKFALKSAPGHIKLHAHKNQNEGGYVDELILRVTGFYGISPQSLSEVIAMKQSHAGEIMRIPSGAEHGGFAHGTWVSIKIDLGKWTHISQADGNMIYADISTGNRILIQKNGNSNKQKAHLPSLSIENTPDTLIIYIG